MIAYTSFTVQSVC